MPITMEQRALRKHRLGASDMPAVMGLVDGFSPRGVWASKVYDVQDTGNEATAAGNALEATLVAYAQDRLGAPVEPNVYCDTGDILAANLDGLCRSLRIGVEGKTHGIVGPAKEAEMWGDDETDEVPDRVIVQATTQMICAEIDEVVVPALVGGRGFRMYRLRRDDALVTAIMEQAEEFWHTYVLPRKEPPGDPPRLDFIRKIVRQEGKVVSIPNEVVIEAAAARAARKAAKKRAEIADAALYAAIGDATTGESGAGRVTIKTVNRKAYECKACSFQQMTFRLDPALMASIVDGDND